MSFITRLTKPTVLVPLGVIGFMSLANPVLASSTESGSHGNIALVFLWIALLLLAAKGSSIVERLGFPAVLGEIIVGAIIGNLGLLGLHFFEPIKTDAIIGFLAQLGVVILLFQIGLESNLHSMYRVGPRALIVALTGVISTFLLGYFLIPFLLPDLSPTTYIFLAGTFTSTSVGISARVFRDLGKLKSSAAQLVLGSAVLDDVIGLIILAVLTAMVTTGDISPVATAVIFAKSVGFLLGSILIGQLLAPQLGRLFSKIHTGTGMKLTLALAFGLIFAYLAQQIELAPIIGAFAAGLVLDPIHFRNFSDPSIVKELRDICQELPKESKNKVENVISHHANHHINDIIEPLGIVFVPLFFVLTGMNVSFEALTDTSVLVAALGLAAIAIVGKLAAGLAADRKNRWLVGWGMVPRGEVQLIFATLGKSLGVIPTNIFSMIVIVVIITTILTPAVIAMIAKKSE